MKHLTDSAVMRICATLVLLTLASLSYAACPGSSAYANIQSIQVGTGGTYYIQLDTSTNTAAVDVCSCRLSGASFLQLYKYETPASDSTKGMIALAMWAKALNKPIGYYSTGCYNNTAGSGYSYFSYIWTQP